MILLTSIDLSVLLPHILLIASGLLVLLTDLLLPAAHKSLNQFFAVLLLAITFLISASTCWTNPLYSEMLNGDRFSMFFFTIFVTAAVLVIMTSDQYLRRTNINFGEFYALIIFAVSGASIMAASADLITLFIGLEIMSVCLYVLAGFQRERRVSNEAALKYFLTGAFFSAFFLYGTMLLFTATGTTSILGILSAANSSSLVFVSGAAMVLMAFGFKASLFPFHFWSPDVYDGAPTPVSAFMATGAKAAAFAALLRVFVHLYPLLGEQMESVLWAVAVATMTIGNVMAISQSNIKRMLAYSSIAHAGYLFVGFIAANQATTQAIMFYLFAYTLMNVGAFTVAHILNARGEEGYKLSNLTGAGIQHPFLAIVMAIFMFSLAGIPPTAGFFGKFFLFKAALDSGFVWLVIIAVLNSALSVFYYLRVLVIMFMQKENNLPEVRWQLPVTAALILCVIGIISFGVFPNVLMDLLKYAVI